MFWPSLTSKVSLPTTKRSRNYLEFISMEKDLRKKNCLYDISRDGDELLALTSFFTRGFTKHLTEANKRYKSLSSSTPTTTIDGQFECLITLWLLFVFTREIIFCWYLAYLVILRSVQLICISRFDDINSHKSNLIWSFCGFFDMLRNICF